jgi:hypothetical protein
VIPGLAAVKDGQASGHHFRVSAGLEVRRIDGFNVIRQRYTHPSLEYRDGGLQDGL